MINSTLFNRWLMEKCDNNQPRNNTWDIPYLQSRLYFCQTWHCWTGLISVHRANACIYSCERVFGSFHIDQARFSQLFGSDEALWYLCNDDGITILVQWNFRPWVRAMFVSPQHSVRAPSICQDLSNFFVYIAGARSDFRDREYDDQREIQSGTWGTGH